MIWRWHTSFETPLRAIVLICAVTPVFAGTVIGSVRLIDSGRGGRRGNTDCSGVVIWLQSSENNVPPIQPRMSQMGQRKKRFDPPVLAIPVGSAVTFPNFDLIFHNAFSNYSGQAFDVGLYPPSVVPKVVFTRPGIVRVFCNIHPTMSAVIVVENTPYMAVSGADGTFRIDGVRPGEYRLHVFDEQASEETLSGLERKLIIGNDPITIPPIEFSESGYIQVPHKNKYGKEYPVVIEDRPIYLPGKRVTH
jgi:plastocyanin